MVSKGVGSVKRSNKMLEGSPLIAVKAGYCDVLISFNFLDLAVGQVSEPWARLICRSGVWKTGPPFNQYESRKRSQR